MNVVTVDHKITVVFVVSPSSLVYLRNFMKTAHSTHCFVVHGSSVNGQLLNIFGR